MIFVSLSAAPGVQLIGLTLCHKLCFSVVIWLNSVIAVSDISISRPDIERKFLSGLIVLDLNLVSRFFLFPF